MTPIQRKLLLHVMKVIREQSVQINETEAMIREYMGCAYKKAVEAIDAIPGIGQVAAEHVPARRRVARRAMFARQIY